MAKKAKDLSKEAWLIKHLRRISSMWPAKNEAVNRAKVKVQIGFYKNGNPEFKTLITCNICKDNFDRTEIDVDHIYPIVNLDGFSDWNTYIERLFCNVNELQVLCKPCHYLKTQAEKDEKKIKNS